MKKFLSIFVALAMVLSLFAGVGARTAKAATPTGGYILGSDNGGTSEWDAITAPQVGLTSVKLTQDTPDGSTYVKFALDGTVKIPDLLAFSGSFWRKFAAATANQMGPQLELDFTAPTGPGHVEVTVMPLQNVTPAITWIQTPVVSTSTPVIFMGNGTGGGSMSGTGTYSLITAEQAIVSDPFFGLDSVPIETWSLTGARIELWNANVGQIVNIDDINIAGTVYALEDPTVTAGPFAVTGTAIPNGTFSPTTQSIANGSPATVTFTAATGYMISTLADSALSGSAATALQAAAVNLTSYTYTISSVTAAHTITAAVVPIQAGPYAVTATPGTNGTLNPATQSIVGGSPATVTITAAAGYRIATLTNTVGVSPVTAAVGLTSYVYTIPSVTVAQTVAATFELIPSFTVTATAGVNGTLLPATQSIVSGSPATVTITAATGYQIATLTDTAPVAPVTAATLQAAAVGLTSYTYTISSVTAAHTVAATFGAYVAAVPAGTVALGTPTQPAGTTSALLGWTYSATDATSFNIYRNLTGTIPTPATTAPIATVASTVLAFTDASTVANQAYYYWVAAVNATGIGTLSTGRFIPITAATVVVPVIPGVTTAGTLTLTPAGNFVGGVDGSGALGVDAIGTVVSGSGTSYVVNVTTAGVGSFDTVNGITVLHDTGVTSVDTDWATTGMKSISFTGSITGIFNVGDTITVAGSSTKGVGKVISINAAGTLAVVNVTTAVVGVIGPKVYTTSYADSTDLDWLTAGTAQPITFDAAVTLVAGDILDVAMLQAVQGTSATAFLIVSGIPVKGDIATVTWQDTLGASHTVSYTTVTGDTAASVALALSQLIHALDLTTGNVDATVAGNLITLTQDVAGVAGNGKKLTATSTAAVTPTLTIHTVGGLNSPAYVELGKTIKLVAVDATGAVISCTWTSVGSAAPAGPSAVVNTSGLVTADLALTGVTVVTATSGSATGVFAVVVIPVQVITSLKINLVPAVPVSTTVQQFGAIASNAAYSALDYTTQAVWTDALPVASIAATTGLLTYSTDETGNVYASAGGITATGNVKITTGVVTLVPVVGPVTKVIVLTIGSDIVTVDGKATTVDASPEITNGRTFVPIRFIAETFGSTVTWLPETKGVTIVLGDTTIGLQIGNATAVINGTIIALDAAPYIKNSRTMVPLRVISESFGGNVAWDPINHIITITYVLPVVPSVP